MADTAESKTSASDRDARPSNNSEYRRENLQGETRAVQREEERGDEEPVEEPEEEAEPVEEDEEEVEEGKGNQGRQEEDEEDAEETVGEQRRGERERVGDRDAAEEEEAGQDLVVVEGDGAVAAAMVVEDSAQPRGVVEEATVEPMEEDEEDGGEDEDGNGDEDEGSGDVEEGEVDEELAPAVANEAEAGRSARSAMALATAASMHELSSELFPLLVERLPEVLGQDATVDPVGKPLECDDAFSCRDRGGELVEVEPI